MLSTMREKTKIVMVILAVAFVGWLVFDVGMGASGRSGGGGVREVGSVDGHPIGYQAWMEAYQGAYEAQRQQNPGVTLTREDQRALEDQAFESLVQDWLIRDELSRRHIAVSDAEIVDAVRRYPPQEVMQSPEFQTQGRFDPQKYDRFLQSNNENTRQYLIALEQRYREQLPRIKLMEQVTADIYVPDAKLWQMWRDQHDSVTVRALVIRPATVSDASVSVSDADMHAYYDAHRAEFKQPARAFLTFVALAKLPTPVDSVLLVQRARALRDSILHGASFADIARTESADTASAANGGLLPVFGHGQMAQAFERVAFSLPIGQVSEPVFTQFGLHLIKVEKRTRDSVTARHILLPIARFGARLDTLLARADSLDRLAGEQPEGSALDSVAKTMHLPIEHGPTLYKGVQYTLGRYTIPDVGVWAFETRPGETSPVIETNGAYYVFRLDSAAAEGVPPYDQVQTQVRAAATREKKRAAAEAIAHDAERRLDQGRTLDQVAQDLGLTVQTLGPFTRTSAVPILGSASPAVGTAFRLRVGERSGLLSNASGFFVLQPERRVRPDSTAWLAQRDQQRAQITQLARQIRLRYYYDGLRRAAKVSDRREQVMRRSAAAQSDAGQGSR